MPWTYDDALGWVNKNIAQPVGAAADAIFSPGQNAVSRNQSVITDTLGHQTNRSPSETTLEDMMSGQLEGKDPEWAERIGQSFKAGMPTLATAAKGAAGVQGLGEQTTPLDLRQDPGPAKSLRELISRIPKPSLSNLPGAFSEGAQQVASIPTATDVPKLVQQIRTKDYPGAIGTGLAGAAQMAAIGAASGMGSGIHPDAAPGIVEDTNAFGGSTRHLGTGKSMLASPHTATAFASELAKQVPQAEFSPEHVTNYANEPEIAALRAKSPNVTIGTETFKAPDGTPMIRMEPTYISRNQHAANQMGTWGNQRANFDLNGGGTEIPLGGSGEPSPDHPIPHPGERVDWLEAQQPQRTPQAFKHFSDTKIPTDADGNAMISGAKRGTGTVKGGETARQMLPGTNWYDANIAPASLGPSEAAIAQKPHEYRVTKNVALADMADPKFAQIVQEQGPYAAEIEAQKLGYDGYKNSNYPGSNFLFGDTTARHINQPPPVMKAPPGGPQTGAVGGGKTRIGAGQLTGKEQATEYGRQYPESDLARLQQEYPTQEPPKPQSLGAAAADYMESIGRAGEEPQVEQTESGAVQGMTPQGAGLSNEELARTEKFYHVKKNGELSYSAQQPDPSTLKNAAVIAIKPTGEMRVANAAMPGMSDAQILSKYGSKVQEAAKPTTEDPIDLLRPEEQTRLNPKQKDQLRQQFEELRSLIPQQQAAAEVGMSASDWWGRGHQAYTALSDSDPAAFPPEYQSKFANVMGATSPHQTVENATLEALHTFNQWKEKIIDQGRPNTAANIARYVKPLSLKTAKMSNLTSALLGQDLFAGRSRQFKAPSMGQALQGETPEAKAAFVGDTHMADMLGIDPKQVRNPQTYYAMTANARKVAQNLNMDTRDVQSAQWATKLAIQEIMGQNPTKGAGAILDRVTPDIVEKYKKDIVDLMQTDLTIRQHLEDVYGTEFRQKLDANLAKIPKTTRQGVPASSRKGELAPLVERLREKYGKPEEPQGDISFDFGANEPPGFLGGLK